ADADFVRRDYHAVPVFFSQPTPAPDTSTLSLHDALPICSRWDPDGRPEKLQRDLEGSLKRLRLERIDLYQLHAPDPKVPFEESLGALAAMQRAGKIRHIGVSNVSVKQLEQARKIVPIVSVQNRYH